MTRGVGDSERHAGRQRELVAGTRGSQLALWQTTFVLGLLRKRWPERTWMLREFSTHGDETPDRPLAEIGGRGAFTEAIEACLERGEIDFAVHSLKDLPLRTAPDLLVAAVVGPRIAGEVLVAGEGRTLATLPRGAVVGTSSLRRQAQLLRSRPDLRVRSIRGNVETRIDKVMRGSYDACLLAAAGVERLGLQDGIAERIDPKVMLPAPGQGAIAVQCRADDPLMIELLAEIADRELADCTTAERGFLEFLGGGCTAPVGALAVRVGDRQGERHDNRSYHLIGRVVAPDGSEAIEVEGAGPDPALLGIRLAGNALRAGAREILSRAGDAPVGGVLSGKRVVVTRPLRQAVELSELLAAQGAEVISVPAVDILPLSNADLLLHHLESLGSYRWLVFTSANAVELFLSEARRQGVTAASIGKRAAVVGPATATALRGFGLEPGFASRGQTAADLARELPEVFGNAILFPCAKHHREELPRILRERGAQLNELAIYRTVPLAVSREGLEQLRRGIDIVTFASGSAVAAFVDALLAEGGRELADRIFRRRSVACIGPSTAKAVERAGYRAGIVAEEHTTEGLVAAIVRAEMESTHEHNG